MTSGDEKAESDVEEDPKVAGAREGKDGDGSSDGSYVGRTFNDDDFDAGETGAEARAQ